ncbi:tetratricopeptide repeat protein [Verrucosispora sp. ts21]|uniref:tetratricopeptide repeat protein n=1 Tax=Verrucosispora sp. ts21 TaxID=2069341 RepID=UPI00256EC51F|nr:tetratricopeptide repeat protein [Verrucosispora sp. ts21]
MPHASPLAVAQQRALALRGAGNHAAARELLSDAFESARPPFGKDHPDVLSTAHLLARLHREADEPSAARRVLEEAFAAGERRWPQSDPLMLALSYELGSVADELGNRHEARRNYLRVATAGPAVLGVDHPAVRAAREYLGDAAPALPPAAPPAGQPASVDQSPHGALAEPTVSLAVLSTAWQPHDASIATAPLPAVAPAASAAPAVPSAPDLPPLAPAVPPVPPPPGPAASVPPAPAVPTPRAAIHDQTARLGEPGLALPPEAASPAAVSPGAASPTATSPEVGDATEVLDLTVPAPSTGSAEQGDGQPAAARQPQWANPTIPVQQIGPLLAEETARLGSRAQATTPPADTAPPVSGPPHSAAPISGPPHGTLPVSGPPQSAPPASGPPPTPPLSGAPTSAPPFVPNDHLSGPQAHQVPGFGDVGQVAPVSPAAHELTAPLPQPGPTSGPPGRVPFPRAAAGSLPGPAAETPAYRPTSGPPRHLPAGDLPGSSGGYGSAGGPQQHGGFGAEDPQRAAQQIPPPPAPPTTPQAYPPPAPPTTPQAYPSPAPPAAPHAYPPPTQPAAPQAYPPPGGPAYPSAGWGQQQPGQLPPGSGGTPPYQGPPMTSAPGRNRVVVVAVVAVVVALAAMLGVGLLLLDRRSAAPSTVPDSSAQPQGGAPPADLALRDDRSTITLTWVDPADGLVPFMVAGGRAGQSLGVMATVGPGETSYTVNGLNSRVDYCFTVLAVYGTDQFATSSQVCTSREG